MGKRPGEVAVYLTQHGLLTKPSTISNWKLRGGIAQPALVTVARIIGVDAHWLMHGGKPAERATVSNPFPGVATPHNRAAVPHVSIADLIDYYATLNAEDRQTVKNMLSVVDRHTMGEVARDKPVKKAVPST